MTEAEIKRLIESAFEGVTLSGGVSLRQADVMDSYGEGCTEAEFAALPQSEITTDWGKLTDDELERYAYLAHMDALGFRYYIPAFILSVLRGAGRCSNVRASTLHCLYPKRDGLWDHCMMHYSAMSELQKSAIAEFIKWVRDHSKYDDDRIDAEHALENYWASYSHEK